MLYDQIVTAFAQQATALLGQLDKAAAWCRDGGVAEADLLATRLAEDMLPLSKQLDFVVAQILQPLRRLTGDIHADPDPADASLASHRTRIAAALDALAGSSPADIDGDPARRIAFDLPNGMHFNLTASEYVRDWAVPQFYFHTVAAYALLRHAGVPLGKVDYVPHMMQHAVRPGAG